MENCAWAVRRLRAIYKPGLRYQKAGVMLADISPAGERQLDLLAGLDAPKSNRAMAAMDQINERFGRGAIKIAAAAGPAIWETRREHLSPSWTTQARDLPVARAV